MIKEIILLVDSQKKNTFVYWQTAYVCVMCIFIGRYSIFTFEKLAEYCTFWIDRRVIGLVGYNSHC